MQSEHAQPQSTVVEQPASPLDVAIVVLNYNTRDLLRDCLRSVLASQGSVRYAICVVDNGSSDGSAQMVELEFPDVRLIVSRANIGYSAGNNLSLRQFGFGRGRPGKARYALLLNPDTLLPANTLQSMLTFMDARPRAGIAGPARAPARRLARSGLPTQLSDPAGQLLPHDRTQSPLPA